MFVLISLRALRLSEDSRPAACYRPLRKQLIRMLYFGSWIYTVTNTCYYMAKYKNILRKTMLNLIISIGNYTVRQVLMKNCTRICMSGISPNTRAICH